MARRAPTRNSLPLTEAEFSDLMRPFAPFEVRPALALAVSGGRDSRALALLAQRWAARRGGRVVALVVDHGLRPESAREAARTRAWLRAQAIDAHVLRWRPARPPATGLQTAARAARYRLLLDWCRIHGVLHLLTAHQADDQAETYALRAARGSGPSGLAAMSAIVEFPEARVLRPLLPVSRARLTATLRARDQSWIDDPSNLDPRFARARLRRDGLPMRRDAALRRAQAFARQRALDEARLAAAMAQCALPHPLGGVLIDHAAWLDTPADLAPAALASIVATVAGADYPPRRGRTAGVVARLRAVAPHSSRPPAGMTLGGCRILWRGGGWLVVREPASIAVADADDIARAPLWDGRFERGGWPPKRRRPAAHTMVMGSTRTAGGVSSTPSSGSGPPAAAEAEVLARPAGAGASAARSVAISGAKVPARPAGSGGGTFSTAANRTLWGRAWPATPGLPALLAAVPGGPGGGPPSAVEGVRRATGGDAAIDQRGRSVVGDAAVTIRFRPVRPLAAGPFFPCFALAKRQIVNR